MLVQACTSLTHIKSYQRTALFLLEQQTLLYWPLTGKVLQFHDAMQAHHTDSTVLHFQYWQSRTSERYSAANLHGKCEKCKNTIFTKNTRFTTNATELQLQVLELICQQTGLLGAVKNWGASVKVDLKEVRWICKLHFHFGLQCVYTYSANFNEFKI